MLAVNMDDELKKEFSKVVKEMGLNASSAVNLFARTVVRERRIPFEVTLRTVEERGSNSYLDGRLQRSVENPSGGAGTNGQD